MKSSVYCRILLVLAVLFPALLSLNGQSVERTISKSFSYVTGATLNVDAKFGNVNILTSDNKTIEVEALIWVKSDDKRVAEDLAAQLDAEISEDNGDINVRSEIPDRISSRENTKFGVDFTIHVPTSIALNLRSRYGAVYIEELAGLAKINVSYGNMKIQSLTHGKDGDLNEINLSYSTGSINEAAWLKLNLSYSKLSITEARAIVALSKYSGLSVDECSSLVVESNYDIYKVGEMKNYVGDLRYSNLTAEEITGKFEISSSYSVVKVGEFGDQFESIKIDNKGGSYKLGISAASSFNIKGEAKRGDISVDGMDNLTKKIENADKYISGSYGTGQKSEINIVATEGSVKINIK